MWRNPMAQNAREMTPRDDIPRRAAGLSATPVRIGLDRKTVLHFLAPFPGSRIYTR